MSSKSLPKFFGDAPETPDAVDETPTIPELFRDPPETPEAGDETPTIPELFRDPPETPEAGDETPTIPEFFRGRHVFVTGGSGFMGKVLLEKLLRSCPDIGSIYILLRPKKGVGVGERLGETLQMPLFDRVRSENPNAFTKLVPIVGDVSELGLGLRSEDRQMLQEAVSVVFHTAASVRFDDAVKEAVITNVRGTREAIQLALGMTKLKVFLHVSTAYCNCDQSIVREKLYPPHGDWKTMIRLAENQDNEQVLCSLTPKILGYLPNTYTYAKSLTEHLIKDFEHRLPVVIFRPSIVGSTVKEPMPGWIDNVNGPTGLLLAGGVGIMRTFYGDVNNRGDYVPVDYSIKALIVAAWQRAVHSEPASVPIYNSTSMVKTYTLTEFAKLAQKCALTYPFRAAIWYPNSTVTQSRTLYFVKVLLYHMLPALLIDGLLMATGRRTKLTKIQKRIYVANMSLARFMFQTLAFENFRCQGLHAAIKTADLEHFRYDQVVTDVDEYMTVSCLGGLLYLLHEKLEDIPLAKIKHRRLFLLHMATKTSFLLLLAYWATPFALALLAQLFALLSRSIVRV